MFSFTNIYYNIRLYYTSNSIKRITKWVANKDKFLHVRPMALDSVGSVLRCSPCERIRRIEFGILHVPLTRNKVLSHYKVDDCLF